MIDDDWEYCFYEYRTCNLQCSSHFDATAVEQDTRYHICSTLTTEVGEVVTERLHNRISDRHLHYYYQ